jgi:hypothetical protein
VTKVFFCLFQVTSDVDINDGTNWAPLLANCGLLLMSCAQCLVTVVAGFRCYRQVCPCTRQGGRKRASSRWALPDSPEPAGSFYSTSSKEMHISNWLGQQRRHNMLLITQPPVSHSVLWLSSGHPSQTGFHSHTLYENMSLDRNNFMHLISNWWTLIVELKFNYLCKEGHWIIRNHALLGWIG